jgi:hypothetical protein
MSLLPTVRTPFERHVLPVVVGVVSWPVRMGLYLVQPRPLPGAHAAALTLHIKSEP